MIKVFKIGGNVVDNDEALARFLDDFASIEGDKVLIHGGGKLATRLSKQLGIETQMIEGRRVTDRDTLDVCTMVYAGLINKRIVAALNARGCKAIGLSGADAGVIPAHTRSPEPIDFGWVGDIDGDKVDHMFIKHLLEIGVTPVFCALTHDCQGNMLNTNADSVASGVAIACARFAPTQLVFCFEKDGVLVDIDDPSSLIETIDKASFEQLKADGIIAAGMVPKVTGALKAVAQGVTEVVIKNSSNITNDRGTTIK